MRTQQCLPHAWAAGESLQVGCEALTQKQAVILSVTGLPDMLDVPGATRMFLASLAFSSSITVLAGLPF